MHCLFPGILNGLEAERIKLFWIVGIPPPQHNNEDDILFTVTSVINYMIWENKLNKRRTQFQSLTHNLFYLLDTICANSVDFLI